MRLEPLLALCLGVVVRAEEEEDEGVDKMSKCGVNSVDVFSHKAQTLEEEETLLEQHRGNVLLVVNVATF